jgi:hypothetical protein
MKGIDISCYSLDKKRKQIFLFSMHRRNSIELKIMMKKL